MKKHKQQMLPLDSDVDALLERLKKESKKPKRHIGNDMIRMAARVRRLPILDSIPKDTKP